MGDEKTYKSLRNMNILIAILFLSFGLLTAGITDNDVSAKWIIITMTFYVLPLAGQIAPNGIFRVYSLWFGVFLVIQTVATPILINKDYVTLPPNMNVKINVIDKVLPGIQGIQHVTTDSRGFRNASSLDEKNKNKFRIFAIGGSTTEQIFIDDKSTWTYLLQKKLNVSTEEFVVTNTGVAGLRAVNHLQTLKNIKEYNPDVVLFLMGANDWIKHIRTNFNSNHYNNNRYSFKNSLFGNLIKQIYQFTKKHLDNSEENLSLRDIQDGKIIEEQGQSYVKKHESLDRNQKKRFRPSSVSKEYKQTLIKISKYCKKNNIRCVFITQPHSYSMSINRDFRKRFWMTPPSESYTLDLESMVYIANLYNSYLINFSKENGFQVIDLASYLSAGSENFYDDMHFNINGSHNVAKVIYKSLVKRINQ